MKKITKKGMLIFIVGIITGMCIFAGIQAFRLQPKEEEKLVQQQPQQEKKEDDKEETSSQYPIWNKANVYVGGDKVIHQNKIYKAKWWTQGEEPGKQDVWEDTKEAIVNKDTQNQNNTSETKPHVNTGDKVIVGYYPSWKPGKKDMIQYDIVTDIVYAFAIPTVDGELRPLDEPELAKEMIEKAHKQNVRVLIGVGGWSYNDVPLEATFVSATENSKKTKKFGDAILKLCHDYGFDGVDMDWEHPRVDGNSAKQYEELMLYLSEKLHAEDKILTSAVLSGATADGNVYYDAAAHSDKVLKAVDRIHVMAYDGGDGERHSTYEFAQDCINYWVNTRNTDPNKVILGVPFYARPSWAGYGDIISSDSKASSKDHITYNGMDVYYNGESTMKKKAEYAKKHAGGIMIWELTQDCEDSDKSLLKVIGDTFKK